MSVRLRPPLPGDLANQEMYRRFPNHYRRKQAGVGRLCRLCARDGYRAVEIDHITPLWRVALMPKERQTIRWWLPGNLQALCRKCHRAKTKREAGERARARSPQKELALGTTS